MRPIRQFPCGELCTFDEFGSVVYQYYKAVFDLGTVENNELLSVVKDLGNICEIARKLFSTKKVKVLRNEQPFLSWRVIPVLDRYSKIPETEICNMYQAELEKVY